MKKIFKAIAILCASTALCAGIGIAAGCSGGKDGKYEGDYHYTNSYGVAYGMKVRVTVKNNIITKVEDITNGAYTIVSPGWVNKWMADQDAAHAADSSKPDTKAQIAKYKEDHASDPGVAYMSDVEIATILAGKAPNWYNWPNSAEATWTDNESWLLQKYEGWSVSDILDIKVFIKETGEPYSKDHNGEFSDLLITGSTQGSGRLLLAVQNALGKKTEIGRIEKAN